MAEPISTIALISALYPILKNGIKNLGISIGESTVGGPIEELSGTLAKKGFKKFYESLPTILKSPENHDLLRSVRRSYLNATLVMCFARLQNINPSRFDVKNLILQFVPNNEEPSRIVETLKNRLLSSDDEANKEIKWLFRAIKHLNAEIANIPYWKVTETVEEVTEKAELLLKPENANTQINHIQLKLKTELTTELASTASFETFYTTESAGKDNYGECLPPEILKSINEGWFLLEDDKSILKQSAERVDFEWFDVLSVFFAEEIKSSTRVNAIFNAKILADLKYQNGQPCNYSADLFAEHLAKANEVIFISLENIKKEIGDINENVRQLLPLITTIESVKGTLQLIRYDLNKGSAESKERDSSLYIAVQGMRDDVHKGFAELQNKIESVGRTKKLLHYINFPANFIGRKDVLDELQKAYDDGIRKFVLHGLGGVGKSWISREFANRNEDTYEAQFFVDMQGFSEEPALSSIETMKQIILKFYKNKPFDFSNLTEPEIKTEYTFVVKQQPTMIILDNAEALESVEALCQDESVFVLITSRNIFNVKGGLSLEIKQMSRTDSESLLLSIADEKRFEGKADELAKLAGYLPMALTVLASNLATDKTETVSNLIIKYQDVQRLFKERVPDYNNLTIDASFELSYKKLSDDLKLCWRWLSVSPSDFDSEAIKGITGVSDAESIEIQKELRSRSLLEYNVDSKRFKLHDLARKFADSKFDEDLSLFRRLVRSIHLWLAPKYAPQERLAANHCHAGYYASTFTKAYEMKFNDPEKGFINALNLIDKEWSNIIAGQKWAAAHAAMHPNYAETCCRYSSISEFFDLRLTPQEAIAWQESSLKAAKLLGNIKREGMYLGNMGIAYRHLGNYEKAVECHTRSLEIAQHLKDEDGEASALGNLAIVYAASGQNHNKALEFLDNVLQMARRTNNRSREGLTLGTLGSIYNSLGDFKKAIELNTQSLDLAREIGDLHGESIALSNLANAYHDLGDREKAREYDEQSLKISQNIGDKLGENLVLQNMNSPRSFSTLEEFETAIENYEELLEASRHDHNPLEEFRCLYYLGMIYLELGVPPKAIEYLDLALTKARQIGDKDKELHCLGNLGDIFGMLGDDQLAIQICGEALELAREVGDRLSEGNNLHMLGLGYAGLGEMKKACMCWKEAFDILEKIKSPSAENVRKLLREAECQ